MLSHLLVPTDFSTPTAKIVENLRIFGQLGAERLTVLHPPPSGGDAGGPVATQQVCEAHFEKCEVHAKRLDLVMETRRMQVRGRPAQRILAMAEKMDADMIAMANRGRSALDDVIQGSVATDVLERSPVPVFLHSLNVGEEVFEDSPILHPTDFSPPSEVAFQWAKRLVASTERAVVLFHVVKNGEEEEARAKLEARAEHLRAAGARHVAIKTPRGRPRKLVANAVQRYFQHVVVMGTRGRSWFDDLVLGGVARRVAREGKNHVLFLPEAS